MTLENYLLFVLAAFVLCIVPGPDIAYLLSRCVAQGRKAGIFAALGINAGQIVHLAAAITGLSAILMTSATAFTVVKWVGAAYLIYLGITNLRRRSPQSNATGERLPHEGHGAVFWQGFVSDVLNPKMAIFFLALLPQFVVVSADGGSPVGQLILLGLTVNVIALSVNLVLITASAEVTAKLRRESSIAGWLQKLMGATFIGLGVRLAFEKN